MVSPSEISARVVIGKPDDLINLKDLPNIIEAVESKYKYYSQVQVQAERLKRAYRLSYD